MGKRGRPPRWKQFEAEFLARLDAERRAWIDQEIGPGGPAELPDLHELSRTELLVTFPGQPLETERGKRTSLNDRRIIRALAWQLAMQICSETLPRIDGNMRTAWYKFVEPFYLEKDFLDSDLGPELNPLEVLLTPEALGALEEAEAQVHLLDWLGRAARSQDSALNRAARERYVLNTMSGAFDDLYLAGILDFEDHYGFEDPGESRYHVGRRKPGKLLATEKLGLMNLAKSIAKKHGCSWYVSNGEPSLLALSFAGKRIKATNKVGILDVGTVVDYDPFGYSIAGSFAEKLTGPSLFQQVRHVRLTGTEAQIRRLFTPKGLERAKRDLGRYHRFKQKQIDAWMLVTGGIGGKPFGAHIDLADLEKLVKQIEEWVLDQFHRRRRRKTVV